MTIQGSHETQSEILVGDDVIAHEITASPLPVETNGITIAKETGIVSANGILQNETDESILPPYGALDADAVILDDAAAEEVSVYGSSDNASANNEALGDVWQESVALLKQSLDAHVFGAYIEPLEIDLTRTTLESLVLLTPNSFLRSYVDRYLREKIESAFSVTLKKTLTLEEAPQIKLSLVLDEGGRRVKDSPYIVVKKIPAAQASAKQSDENRTFFSANTAAAGAPKGPLAVGLNPRYTFGNFVVGNSNQFCHAAALRAAENPGRSYNPLFVYGGVGLGKTHLLHAIGNLYLERNPNGRVVYMSSETFTNELIIALRYAKMEEFKSKMRNIEVLLIDDIQFMRGKERTQEEFFHTFNALYNAKHQIVITSDRIPSDIPGLEERLQTRFSWGLTADIQAPDFETRVAILKRKASLDNFELPENVAHMIADNISSNVRELEGALTRINAMSSLQNVPLTVELAESALRPLLQPRNVNFSIEDIKKAVALHFGIKTSEMISKRRTKNLSLPRHVAMYLCRKHTTASYPEIGAEFGGRDHSSVIHAANVVAVKIKKDVELAKAVEGIEKKLVSP